MENIQNIHQPDNSKFDYFDVLAFSREKKVSLIELLINQNKVATRVKNEILIFLKIYL